jgi:hypothetical protein
MRWLLGMVVICVTAMTWAGCGDDDQNAPDDASATLDFAHLPDSAVARDLSVHTDNMDFGFCPSVPSNYLAPLVMPSLETAPAPAAAGGTIVDGLYYLTADTFYVDHADMGVMAGSAQAAYDFHANVVEATYNYVGMLSSGGDTFTTSGTTLTATFYCGPDSAGFTTAEYTATPTTITLFIATTHGTQPAVEVRVLTKQ